MGEGIRMNSLVNYSTIDLELCMASNVQVEVSWMTTSSISKTSSHLTDLKDQDRGSRNVCG
jgi:hypothetical protein